MEAESGVAVDEADIHRLPPHLPFHRYFGQKDTRRYLFSVFTLERTQTKTSDGHITKSSHCTASEFAKDRLLRLENARALWETQK